MRNAGNNKNANQQCRPNCPGWREGQSVAEVVQFCLKAFGYVLPHQNTRRLLLSATRVHPIAPSRNLCPPHQHFLHALSCIPKPELASKRLHRYLIGTARYAGRIARCHVAHSLTDFVLVLKLAMLKCKLTTSMRRRQALRCGCRVVASRVGPTT